MQRRVATIYFVFFLVMGASAYSVIAVADSPQMELSGEELAQGDSFQVGDETYTVSTIEAEEGSVVGELVWTNESARYTETVSSNTTLNPAQFAFDGQDARYTTTLADGDSVEFNGSAATVDLNASAGSFDLVRDGNVTTTVAVNDSFAYEGNSTTVYSVTEDGATLVWGEPYTIYADNATRTFRAVQTFNVSQRLAADSAVENQTVTRDDGNEYVVYRANGTTELLSSYLPAPDEAVISEGSTVTYARNEAVVENVSADGVRFAWTGPSENSVELEEGSNVTLSDVQHVVYFPDEEHVQLSPDVGEYQETRKTQDAFKQRQNGLWGVTILSGASTFLIIALAFLPTKD
ncbi:hypothetical protein N0B31_16150 [Salinirubellus salinus]|uniref:Uncharacterized protein n=1 Tax=Salinirubellus salinus TaxID=1364945 RepID=A0A9E7UA54_9EURY|nr:hypothetical protein [Salinirubellus salinus]UWM53657.1 hypothetical protein N0B31_16150 [Salinirubellus salinus]